MTLEYAVSDDAVLSAPIDASATSPVDTAAETRAADSIFPPTLRAALEGRGYSEPTAVQRAVLEAEVEGKDLQISSQTGSGKTVALGFVLASTLADKRKGNGPEALIIVPTRELATQVCQELHWLFADLSEVSVASVTGGTPMHRDRQLLARRPRVLVGTPGRLLDHVKSGQVKLAGVRELVLDEADQMLDMGFREELEGILDTTPETRRTHMVSATFPAGIQRLAERYQRNPVSIEGTRLGDANQDIEHEGHVVHARDRYDAVVNLLLLAEGERTLVFVERRSDAMELAERLEADGFSALPLSGELAQSQRERTLAAFRAGRVSVLVATDVAARGLDVPDVATVIHTAPPIDPQVYTHRSGRTGRAGKRGRSVLFAPPNRRRKVARLLADAGVQFTWQPLPSAEDVRTKLVTRAESAVRAELDAALAAGPSAAHVAQAEQLLEGRAAAPVVAALLARLEPERRAEPRNLENPQETPRENPRRNGAPWGQSGARNERPAHRARSSRGDSVRFFINWGANQGANPSRVLAAICRRGEIDGSAIGSIAIHPNATTFDVQADMAQHFEYLAGRRDPRDPQVRIRLDRGPQAGSGPQGGRGPRRPRY